MEDLTCSICLKDVSTTSFYTCKTCKKSLHPLCFDSWKHKKTCPTCRETDSVHFQEREELFFESFQEPFDPDYQSPKERKRLFDESLKEFPGLDLMNIEEYQALEAEKIGEGEHQF